MVGRRFCTLLLGMMLFSMMFCSGGCGGGSSNSVTQNPGTNPIVSPDPTPNPTPITSPDPEPETPVVGPSPTTRRTVEQIIADKEDIINNPIWIELTSYNAIASTISSDLITLAKSRPEITAENHPRWKGFICGGGIDIFDWIDDGQITDTLDAVENFVEWGFNAVRIMWGFYTTKFFNDLEASKVNLKVLKYLDRILEVAIKNDMHLDFTFTNWPGFWNSLWGDYEGSPEGYEPYKSYGEFDLWVNPARKARCVEMLKMLARRYKDVPNRNFSIYIMFEPGNNSRSTGLPVPEGITDTVIGETLELFVKAIREVDPNRLIVFESNPDTSYPDPYESRFYEDGKMALDCHHLIQSYVKDKYSNILFEYNYCVNPVAFHGMNANENGESGYQNVDHNNTTSSVPRQYPVTFYGIPQYSNGETRATKISGFLPDSTKIRIPIVNAWGGLIIIRADGNIIHQEILPNDTDYLYNAERIGFLMSYYNSEKTIEVEIPNNTTEIAISCENGGAYNIGGIEIIYPENCAVNKWYYKTTYSAFTEGNQDDAGIFQKSVHSVQIPIAYNDVNEDGTIDIEFGIRAPVVELKSDMTFTTNYMIGKYDTEHINNSGKRIFNINNDNHLVLRIECANFQSMEWGAMTRYYKDFYSMCEEQGFDVFINDWYLVQNPFQFCEKSIVNQPQTQNYRQWKQFNMPLLNFIRQNLLHQN